MSDKDKIWETADGRQIPLEDMSNYHVENAHQKIKGWSKREQDPARRADLTGWRKTFAREKRRRWAAWLEARRARESSRD